MKEQNPTAIPEEDPIVTEQEVVETVEAPDENTEPTFDHKPETQSKIENVRKNLEEIPDILIHAGGSKEDNDFRTFFTGLPRLDGKDAFQMGTMEPLPLDDVDIFNEVFGKSFFGGIFNMFRLSKWKEFFKKRKANNELNDEKYGHLNR